MPALHILIADDQIPPPNMPEKDYRQRLLDEYGDNAQTRAFIKQCIFMQDVVQELRDLGYHVTAVNEYADAEKEVSQGKFDLAIIDLGWFMDRSLPENDRPSAGWTLCKQLDDQDERSGKRTPQILFSSRFPEKPELSREAARRQKLPIFKAANDVVRNSLIAAVGFVDATLAGQRSVSVPPVDHFDLELQNIALSLFKEPLHDYRRWTFLTLGFVAISLALLLAGVALAYAGAMTVATLSSIVSIVSGTISALLYKRLSTAHAALENVRRDILGRLKGRPKEAG